MKIAAARTWKSLTSKLHSPLPLSPRECQGLLSALNASFKQQLDREHLDGSSSNEHHANNHLQSILMDPLFDAKPRTRASFRNKRQNSGKLLGQLQNHMARPMDAFKEQVSQGLADLEKAKFWLGIQYKRCWASPAATVREAMQSSGAASTMLQWLWASGMEDTGEFLKDEDFVTQVAPFLVSEGQHSRILRWLYRCSSPKETPYSSLRGLDTHGIRSALFKSLIQGETRIGDGLESAITMFIRIVAGLRDAGSTESSTQNVAIQASWTLTKTILRLPKAAQREMSILRPFLETMRNLNNDLLLNASLCVFFQEPPDPQPALTYFRISAKSPLHKKAVRPHIVHLGLKAAELFLQDGRQNEALWIMEFLATNYAMELGSPQDPIRRLIALDKPEKMLRKEEKSLLLLDALAVQ